MSDARNCEFVEWQTEPINFASSWQTKRDYESKQLQTEDLKMTEQGIQSMSLQTKSVQTDFEEKRIEVKTMNPPYPPSLYAFFSRVTDDMCRCLEENLDPFAFEVFKDAGDADNNDDGENVRGKEAVKKFTFKSPSTSVNVEAGSCVAWNSKGTQVAIGYMCPSHLAWCSHHAPISIWNLSRPHFLENKPHAEVVLPSCITCIEFHPSHPFVLAVGMISGGVAIIDFSIIDPSAAKSESQQEQIREQNKTPFEPPPKTLLGGIKKGEQMSQLGYFIARPEHSLSITSIHWMKLSASQSAELIVKNKNPSQTCLVSAGKDGYICLWSTNTSNTKIQLEKKFIIWADNIPGDVPIGLKSRISLKQIGILGLGTCKDDPFACILAIFGGFIFQGNLDSNIDAYTAMSELETNCALTHNILLDPGLVFISQNQGNVKIVACSPFHRNVFLVATIDGRITVQNILEPSKPIMEFNLDSDFHEPLNDAKWSPSPTVFAVASGKTVSVFDLKKGYVPILTIPHENLVTGVAFNDNDTGTIATCDINGFVYVWRLPTTFNPHDTPHDLDVLISQNNVDVDQNSYSTLEEK